MERIDEFRDYTRILRTVPKVTSPLTVKLSDVMGEGMAGRHGIPPDSESYVLHTVMTLKPVLTLSRSQPGVQERSSTSPSKETDNGTPHVDGGGGTGGALCYIYDCNKSIPKDSVSGRKHLRDAHGKLLEKKHVKCDATGCGTTLSVAAFPVHYLGHLKLYTYKCPSVYCTHNSRPDTFGRHLDSTRCHLCPRCLVDFESLKARNIHRATCAYPVLMFPRDWAQREFSDWTSQEAQAAELATRVFRAKLRQR